VSQPIPEKDLIEDTDKLNQKMQIRNINEQQSKVASVRNEAHKQINSVSPQKSNSVRRRGCRVYLEVLKTYIMQMSAEIRNKTPELWEKKELLEVEIYHTPKREKDLVGIQPNPASKTVVGIKGLLETEFPIRKRFDVTYSDTSSGEETFVEIGEYTPAFSEIDNILIDVEQARKKFNLGLNEPEEIGVESEQAY